MGFTMLKLHCAGLLEHLKKKPLFLMNMVSGEPIAVQANDKRRAAILSPLISNIHKSQKFIFDSGSDQDPQTVLAVHKTALNMMQANLFHQPYPVIFIEDPFEEFPDKQRNYYLAREFDNKIDIWFIQRFDVSSYSLNSQFPNILFHPHPLVIDLAKPSNEFIIHGIENVPEFYEKALGEAVYSYLKFIVTLNTTNLEMTKINPSKNGSSNIGRSKQYEHTIVSIPFDRTSQDSSRHSSRTGAKLKRKTLVRGYTWGKATRPLDEQRWIAAYWRGENEIKERTHYVVR